MLIGWIAAVIGIVIVVFSLNRLIKEIRKAGIPNMEDQAFSDTFYALLSRVDQLGEDLDDINQAFYESTERLERRLEVLENTKIKADKKRILHKNMDMAFEQQRTAAEVHEPLSDTDAAIAAQPTEAMIRARIKALLDDGVDTPQIAKMMNLGVGEVELIRRLHPVNAGKKQ